MRILKTNIPQILDYDWNLPNVEKSVNCYEDGYYNITS